MEELGRCLITAYWVDLWLNENGPANLGGSFASPNTDWEKGGKPQSAPRSINSARGGLTFQLVKKTTNIQHDCQAKGCVKIGKSQPDRQMGLFHLR